MEPQITKEIVKGKSLETSYFLLKIYSNENSMVLTYV